MLDLVGFILSVPFGEAGPIALGHSLVALIEVLAHLPAPGPLLLRIRGQEIGRPIGSALIKLRDQRIEGVELFFDHRIDRDSDISLKRIRLLEPVGVVKKDRIIFEGGDVRAKKGDGDHVGCVLDEDAGVAVVRMIIVGP